MAANGTWVPASTAHDAGPLMRAVLGLNSAAVKQQICAYLDLRVRPDQLHILLCRLPCCRVPCCRHPCCRHHELRQLLNFPPVEAWRAGAAEQQLLGKPQDFAASGARAAAADAAAADAAAAPRRVGHAEAWLGHRAWLGTAQSAGRRQCAAHCCTERLKRTDNTGEATGSVLEASWWAAAALPLRAGPRLSPRQRFLFSQFTVQEHSHSSTACYPDQCWSQGRRQPA